MDKGAKNKHQLKKELSYERFIEAGFRVFAQKGYEKASVDDIAKEAGYTKGAFYVHFKSKEQLFLQIDAERDRRRAEAYKTLFYGAFRDHRPFDEVIRSLADILLEDSYKQTDWGLLAIEFLLHNARNRQMAQLNEAKYENWRRVIEQIIAWGKQTKQLSEELDEQSAVSSIFALYDGYFVHSALYPGKVRKEDVVSGLLKLFAYDR